MTTICWYGRVNGENKLLACVKLLGGKVIGSLPTLPPAWAFPEGSWTTVIGGSSRRLPGFAPVSKCLEVS